MKGEIFHTAIYIRLSREDGDREESESVGNQRRLLSEYVEKREELYLYDTYVDDGYTGTNFRRPGFRRMIDDIEAGRVNCVVVKDLSRFGRDYIDTGRYLERYFPEKGVRFLSVTEGIDSIRQTYDILLPIKNIFNEQYARDISHKIQATVASKQKAGEFIGAFASYGYRKSPGNKNKLVIDPYAAGVVRKIFSLYIQGMGKQTIANRLNEEGILCPSEYKRLHGENYKNSHRLDTTSYWTYSTIHKMLQNEMYIGNMVQGKKHQSMRGRQKQISPDHWIRVEHTHEPIISSYTWDTVQNLLGKKHRDIDFESNKNIFAGFLKCGDCGRAMAKNCWQRADGSQIQVFYCGTYKRRGKKYCTPHNISYGALYEIVEKELSAMIGSISNLQELVGDEENGAYEGDMAANRECREIMSKLEQLERQKKSIYQDYKEGLISKKEYLSYRAEYEKREELYNRSKKNMEEKQKENVTQDQRKQSWIKMLVEDKKIGELDRGMIADMIHQIRVYEEHRVEIIYNTKEFADI